MIPTNIREGEYYYSRHRSSWGVWRAGKLINGVRLSTFISDFSTQIQADNFCRRMNGKLPIEEEEDV